jgi:hypothetical protein
MEGPGIMKSGKYGEARSENVSFGCKKWRKGLLMCL